MKITPLSRHVLIKPVDIRFSKIALSTIVQSPYGCGKIISDNPGTIKGRMFYKNDIVIFVQTPSVPLKIKNDNGTIEDLFLVEKEYILAEIQNIEDAAIA